MKIALYMGAWPTNIGNAFFDLGAEAILEAAQPSARVFRTGGAVRWMFNASARSRQGRLVSRLRDKLGRPSQSSNALEISEVAEVDVVVFPGMSICDEFLHNNAPSLQTAAEHGAAILGLGVGAANYTRGEARNFAAFINSLPRASLITRDSRTHELLNESGARRVHLGIDCAFFLPEAFNPPALRLGTFDAVTFDATVPAAFDRSQVQRPIYLHHDLWGPLPRKYVSTPRTLVSDVPEDYLSIYAAAASTYSDRVHACLAALAYGNSARLFSSTQRAGLFDRLGVSEVSERLVRCDTSFLHSRKNEMVDLTRAVLEELLD